MTLGCGHSLSISAGVARWVSHETASHRMGLANGSGEMKLWMGVAKMSCEDELQTGVAKLSHEDESQRGGRRK